MFRRIRALVKKEFIHLLNDWWMPAFMLFGGMLELLLVGWATSRPMTNLPLMIWNQDQSAASRQIITALENTGTFRLDYAESMEPITYALDRGKINAAIIIPPNYSEEIASFDGHPTLSVILNGAESIPAMEAWRAIEGVTRDIGENIIVNRMGIDPDAFQGFGLSLRVWFNEALSEALYSTPAELGLMLEFTTLLFAALAFSRERELGTLEQLLVMPFSSFELIIGKAIPVIMIGLSDFALMLGMVHLAFKVPIRGSLLLLFVLAFVYLLVELSKGMVISIISKSQHQAFLLVMLIGMGDFIFTGYAAPVESMPMVIQHIAKIIPAHHWLTIMRGILLKGAGINVLWPNVLALLGIGLVVITFSWRFIRRNID